MKLNFWQWLGVVLLVIATVLWIMRQINASKEAEFRTPAVNFTEEEPATEPTTEPAAEPAP